MYYVSNRARSAGKLCAKKGARLVRSYAIFFSSRISFLCGATTLRKHSFSTTASRQHTSYFFLQFSYYPTYLLQYREKWKRFQSLQTFQICRIIVICIGFAKGQIKPKAGLEGCRFSQKTNERIWFVCCEKQKSKQIKFIRLFFGRIYGAPICFWFYLTFIT